MAWFQYVLSHTTPDVNRELYAIPGVTARDLSVTAHDNAGWLVERILNAHGVNFRARLMRADYDDITDLRKLVDYGLREWVPDFMTPYQRDAVVRMSGKSGHFWHAAGCLAGDTEIVVNRDGCSRRVQLRELVAEFNDVGPTYTQSLDQTTGCIVGNRIVAAVESGEKAVWRLVTEGGAEIDATADHRFWTPGGWRKLGELHEGGEVMVEAHSAKAVPTKITQLYQNGVKATYDLTMEDPHNSFVANGFVVHNSGKTLSAIAWSLCHPGNTVVTTRAPVRRQFAREIERFTQHRAYVIEDGSDCDIDKIEGSEAFFVVVGWEALPSMVDTLIRWKPVNWVADELHKCKSHRRWGATPTESGKLMFSPLDNIAHAAMKLSRATKRRIGCTATPIKDRTRDLWAQLDLIHPDAWGPFYNEQRASFAVRYCAARRGAYGGIDTTGASHLDELDGRVEIVTDTVPHSVTHRSLPPRRRIVTYVTPNEQVRPTGFARTIKQAAKAGRGALLEARLMEAAARKRKVLLSLVEEAIAAGQKVVIFTGRREDCDQLGAEVAKAADSTTKVYVGHGGISTKVRDAMVLDYMAAPGPAIFVGTGDAFGEGVSLHDTDLHIMAMLPYTPGQVVQWEGRCCRLGQTRPVMIQYLVAEGTVDEHVSGILLAKLPAVERVSQDDSIEGFADQLLGLENEEAILDGLFAKLEAT